MPDPRRRSCKVCDRHESEVGPISWRGKCGDCGPRLAVEAYEDLHHHRGPVFERWRRQTVAAYGGILLEDLEALAAALPDDA